MFDFQNQTLGSSGKIVEKLQGWLNELLKLKPTLDVNGFFDTKTGAAVKRFQQLNNLPVNREPVVTFKTWRTLGKKESWANVESLTTRTFLRRSRK
jgi:peptidoglycan hydrolase-like protein with peptidoglycan-binding domain